MIAGTMFFPKTNVKNDPVRRWHRPDRHFFANGACQVLAFAFLERYPGLGFHARWIKPAEGGDSFPAGMQRWWICQPTFWFQNGAHAISKDFGSVNRTSFFATRCPVPGTFSKNSAISEAGLPPPQPLTSPPQ